MFLNFLLHKNMKRLSGVDVCYVQSPDMLDQEWESQRSCNWERWCRNWMGLCNSPYHSIQMLVCLKFIAYGNRRDRSNLFY